MNSVAICLLFFFLKKIEIKGWYIYIVNNNNKEILRIYTNCEKILNTGRFLYQNQIMWLLSAPKSGKINM